MPIQTVALQDAKGELLTDALPSRQPAKLPIPQLAEPLSRPPCTPRPVHCCTMLWKTIDCGVGVTLRPGLTFIDPVTRHAPALAAAVWVGAVMPIAAVMVTTIVAAASRRRNLSMSFPSLPVPRPGGR